MPRDSSGTYTPSPSTPHVPGTPITASIANQRASDLATEITDSLCRSGKGGMLAPLTFTGILATIRSGIADGASAVGHVLDTVNALTTSGAKLLSVRNLGTEKLAVDKDGAILGASGGSAIVAKGTSADGASAVGVALDTSVAYAAAASRLLSVRNNGTEKVAIDKDGAVVSPVADGGTAIGVILRTLNTLATSGAKVLSVRNGTTEYLFLSKDGQLQVTSAPGVNTSAIWGTGRGGLPGILGSNLANGPGVTADVTTGTGQRGALRLAPQAAPSAPDDGDMWIETGTNTLKVRINGVTKTVTLT